MKDPIFEQAHTNRNFYIAHCDDLASKQWVTNMVPEYTYSVTSEITQVVVPSDAPQRFYKVVEKPYIAPVKE